MINNILNKLNLKVDENQKWILINLFLIGLVQTYISPIITKSIITELPPEWIAFQAVVASITTIICGIIWQGNVRQSICNNFVKFGISESLAGCLVGLYLAFIQYNAWIFAIATLIYTNLITIFVNKCIMTFKTIIWPSTQREIYDNNTSIIAGITCIIGFSLSLIAMPTLHTALILWSATCLLDNIAWIYTYKNNKNNLFISNNKINNNNQ